MNINYLFILLNNFILFLLRDYEEGPSSWTVDDVQNVL